MLNLTPCAILGCATIPLPFLFFSLIRLTHYFTDSICPACICWPKGHLLQ
nr:MAG TPA: hypothetical protein [Caudoviricetes sp.]